MTLMTSRLPCRRLVFAHVRNSIVGSTSRARTMLLAPAFAWQRHGRCNAGAQLTCATCGGGTVGGTLAPWSASRAECAATALAVGTIGVCIRFRAPALAALHVQIGCIFRCTSTCGQRAVVQSGARRVAPDAAFALAKRRAMLLRAAPRLASLIARIVTGNSSGARTLGVVSLAHVASFAPAMHTHARVANACKRPAHALDAGREGGGAREWLFESGGAR